MREGDVGVVSPGAYVVSDGAGDLGGWGESGLFYRDMRHLSRYVLRVDGEALEPGGHESRGSGVRFVSESGGVGVVRRRDTGFGMREEISFANRASEAREVRVDLECAADFLDVFEVRGYAMAKERGEVSEEVRDGGLRFSYERDGFRRATKIEVSGEGIEAEAAPGAISTRFRIDAGETRRLRVSVVFEEDGEKVRWRDPESLYGSVPEIKAEENTARTWGRSVEDLETLAFETGGLLVPAAGSPWYMALFGRDSLITSHMTMMLGAEPAKNTLRALSRHQAERFDDFTDAEPGKILHEMRRGELAFFGESPETPYYGTADATPLFLILLEEVWRWTADDDFIREMEDAARAALAWISASLEAGDGFITYERRSASGLENQSWKDSEDSMLFRDGSKAEGSIAASEIQGYAYDAFLRTADLAENVWNDEALAAELRKEAASLKDRFDRAFWMDDRKYYALALDGEGRKVDSTTSNAGHLLWSGIVPAEKARLVADTLLGEDLFSGWGVCTMAEGEGGYDPLSYHNGSVWPHDNAIIAEGMRKYGLHEEARRVADAIFEAAPHFDHRLPEVFAGHRRGEGHPPAELPRSCSPQAWAAASAVSLVRTMLGLDPDAGRRELHAENAASTIRLSGVPAFGEHHDVRSDA
ncbi:MAG: amylo-alpha-1,6-glucosidase [Rubrobacter sp.]|nr:amylo-alpha-1,6-glucosidase [Rubrobacter sp.]